MYENLECCRCKTSLTVKKVNFDYLAHNFFADVPVCPECGQVYVSEELAKGKMADLERHLEEK